MTKRRPILQKPIYYRLTWVEDETRVVQTRHERICSTWQEALDLIKWHNCFRGIIHGHRLTKEGALDVEDQHD